MLDAVTGFLTRWHTAKTVVIIVYFEVSRWAAVVGRIVTARDACVQRVVGSDCSIGVARKVGVITGRRFIAAGWGEAAYTITSIAGVTLTEPTACGISARRIYIAVAIIDKAFDDVDTGVTVRLKAWIAHARKTPWCICTGRIAVTRGLVSIAFIDVYGTGLTEPTLVARGSAYAIVTVSCSVLYGTCERTRTTICSVGVYVNFAAISPVVVAIAHTKSTCRY